MSYTVEESTTIYMIGARTKVIVQGGTDNQNTINKGTIIQDGDANDLPIYTADSSD